jgi:hypothetical protein
MSDRGSKIMFSILKEGFRKDGQANGLAKKTKTAFGF